MIPIGRVWSATPSTSQPSGQVSREKALIHLLPLRASIHQVGGTPVAALCCLSGFELTLHAAAKYPRGFSRRCHNVGRGSQGSVQVTQRHVNPAHAHSPQRLKSGWTICTTRRGQFVMAKFRKSAPFPVLRPIDTRPRRSLWPDLINVRDSRSFDSRSHPASRGAAKHRSITLFHDIQQSSPYKQSLF